MSHKFLLPEILTPRMGVHVGEEVYIIFITNQSLYLYFSMFVCMCVHACPATAIKILG